MAIKRIFDITISLILLCVLFPIIAFIFLVVWINMGRPVIFRQPRLGYQGKPFVLMKFRTMKDQVNAVGELLPDADRITRLGNFLRSTSLDELPELWNVLRGDMSIVGPRPLLVEYKELYTPEQWRRHEMPPGMAGPVLAEGRNALSWEEKFNQDIAYVDNWSLGLDLKILWKTGLAVLRREGTSAAGHATMPRFEGKKMDSENE